MDDPKSSCGCALGNVNHVHIKLHLLYMKVVHALLDKVGISHRRWPLDQPGYPCTKGQQQNTRDRTVCVFYHRKYTACPVPATPVQRDLLTMLYDGDAGKSGGGAIPGVSPPGCFATLREARG